LGIPNSDGLSSFAPLKRPTSDGTKSFSDTATARELLGTPLNSAMEVLQDRARRLLRILDVKLIPKDEQKGGGVRMFGVISTAPRS